MDEKDRHNPCYRYRRIRDDLPHQRIWRIMSGNIVHTVPSVGNKCFGCPFPHKHPEVHMPTFDICNEVEETLKKQRIERLQYT